MLPASCLTLSYCLNTIFVKKKTTCFFLMENKQRKEVHKPTAQTPSFPGASLALWALLRPGQVPSLMAHATLIQGHLSAYLCPSPDSESLMRLHNSRRPREHRDDSPILWTRKLRLREVKHLPPVTQWV